MIISERMVAAREPQAASVAQETAAAEADAGAALGKLGLAATGALALEACGGGSGSSGGGTPPPVLSSTQASRFLSQSAIGYSHADVTSVSTSGIDAWLTAQFAMARPQKFWDFLVANGYAASTNPTLANGGPDDIGQGRLIPTLSVDQYAATLASWFGVSNSDLATVVPNIGNYAGSALGTNVGFV